MTDKPEVLAPAGNRAKAEAAIAYGADALYLAGQRFGMRAAAGNFDDSSLAALVEYAHRHGVKVYVTVNIFAHEHHLTGIPEHLEYLADLAVDGVIVADPGVVRLAQKYAPNVPLHISTQANVTNSEALRFWADQGAKRVVLARELHREEVAALAAAGAAQVEVFVHGAMCMAYSGRCLLSAVLTGREANLGACAQSCRWAYAVNEQSRPGEYFPIDETQEGTYVFNSKDLCLVREVPELAVMGVDSLKIEGRMKSVYYTAAVTRAYRLAVDAAAAGNWNEDLAAALYRELEKVSHRPYYAGFFHCEQPGTEQHSAAYVQTWDFVGLVKTYDPSRGRAYIEVRNRLRRGDEVEVLQPGPNVLKLRLDEVILASNEAFVDEVHANSHIWLAMDPVPPYSLLRRAANGNQDQ